MPPKQGLRLHNQECLLPGPNHPRQKHQEKPIGLPTGRSFDVPTQDDELLPQHGVFNKQFGLPFGKACDRSEVERGFIQRTMPSRST